MIKYRYILTWIINSRGSVIFAEGHLREPKDFKNEKEEHLWSKICVIQGINFDAITFIDDITEVCKSQHDVIVSSARLEVFQNETRLKFKPGKCKLIVMNEKEIIQDTIGNISLEKVKKHTYLGTVISSDGKRYEEIISRVAATKSVCNEIVLILKTTELARVRLKYVMMLAKSCVDSKIKFGCALWGNLTVKQRKEINGIKINFVKRTMELPFSTPSIAIQYEFGIVDMDLEVCMEKVLLYYEMTKKDERSVGKKMLNEMMKKKIVGFCTEVESAFCTLHLDEEKPDPAKSMKEIRQIIKTKLVELQQRRVMDGMMEASKTDAMLMQNFVFDGKVKKYLTHLQFEQARAVFMLRSRMLPTKENFKGRWKSQECLYCHRLESDMHLFSCPGYDDLLSGKEYWKFMSLSMDMEELVDGAKMLIKVKERLELINKDE